MFARSELMTTTDLRFRPLQPFGLEVRVRHAPGDVADLPVDLMRSWVAEHGVLVLRGFSLFPTPENLAEYCRSWGDLLRWNFGEVLDLVEQEQPQNYLFTNGSVPYHWDGAFAAQVPSLLFFQCLAAPGRDAGGETLFCDTPRVWDMVEPATRDEWEHVRITYRTSKVAHYGGTVTAPLVSQHPYDGSTTLRYAEPANATTVQINTPELEVNGLAALDVKAFLSDLHERLYDPRCVYAHAWRPGDLLVADNHRLLHGRHAYRAGAFRRLQRVHIL